MQAAKIDCERQRDSGLLLWGASSMLVHLLDEMDDVLVLALRTLKKRQVRLLPCVRCVSCSAVMRYRLTAFARGSISTRAQSLTPVCVSGGQDPTHNKPETAFDRKIIARAKSFYGESVRSADIQSAVPWDNASAMPLPDPSASQGAAAEAGIESLSEVKEVADAVVNRLGKPDGLLGWLLKIRRVGGIFWPISKLLDVFNTYAMMDATSALDGLIRAYGKAADVLPCLNHSDEVVARVLADFKLTVRAAEVRLAEIRETHTRAFEQTRSV